MGKTAFSECGRFDGDNFFAVLDGRLGSEAKKTVAAAFAATVGRGGLAYVERKTGLSRATLKAAVSELKKAAHP